jgi:ABC-type polysaccharide/polyol phosphate transport system ATPase subunit
VNDLALSVKGLKKRYPRTEGGGKSLRQIFNRSRDQRHFWALDDISFDVTKGDAVGIIGHNGAGKSTFLKIISRIVAPTAGEVELYGSVNSLLEVGTGFQPDLTGRANIFLNASILGMSRKDIVAVYEDIVEFSGLRDFIDMPVKHYSSGMYSRLAFAIAANVTGDILALDEVLAVGDAEFRRKCLARMDSLIGGKDRSVLFVSHSMDAILRLCNKAIWLDHGKLRAEGAADDVVREYLRSVSPVCSSVRLPNLEDEHSWDIAESDAVAAVAKDGSPTAPKARMSAFLEDSATGIARIALVKIVDDGGKTTEVFFRDQPVTVIFEVQMTQSEAVCGFVAVRCSPRKGVSETVPLFSAYSPPMSLNAGTSTFRVTIPSNLFTSAIYHLTVAVLTPGSPVIKHHMLKQVLSFQVAERDNDNEMMGDYVRGVIRLNLKWGCSTHDEAEDKNNQNLPIRA